MQLLVDFGGRGQPVFTQLSQLVLQVYTANREKKPLAFLQNLIQLGLVLHQTSFQVLVHREAINYCKFLGLLLNIALQEPSFLPGKD